jgi:polysaccharide export outer membrane protein
VISRAVVFDDPALIMGTYLSRVLVLVSLAVPGLLGCGSTGAYVWVNELPQQDETLSNDYIIAAGDVVSIRVFNQENMSTRARVRTDGKLAVPFLGDVEVRGKPPAQLAKELEGRFKDYVNSPTVTVTIEEFQPTSISVVGEVLHAGVFTIDPSAGVLQALAIAGGINEYASRDAIYVIRRSPMRRIRFTYESLIHNEGRSATFRLRTGDVVVVE